MTTNWEVEIPFVYKLCHDVGAATNLFQSAIVEEEREAHLVDESASGLVCHIADGASPLHQGARQRRRGRSKSRAD
jgi:hypothetical protein